MKWIPINKARPEFKVNYLIKLDKESKIEELPNEYTTGRLLESKRTEYGVDHLFESESGIAVGATHIAIITEPEA